MRTLAENLIAKIHPEISQLWAVADGDGLFRSDEVTRLLAERGIEIFLYEDPMAFRFRYEHEMRPQLLSPEPACYVLVVEPGNDGLRRLPADIYQSSRHIEVALGDLFPNFSRRVLCELEPQVLENLWAKKTQVPAGVLGDRDTADLVLRLSYKIEPSFLNTSQDLVQALVGIHFESIHLPEVLAQRLEEVARANIGSVDDLAAIIRKPGEFWQFLQERWENWILPEKERNVREIQTAEFSFAEPKLRVWMDNLFTEGILRPLEAKPEKLPQPWCSVGIVQSAKIKASAEMADQRKRLLEVLPNEEASYKEWLSFARRYSSHVAQVFGQDHDLEITSDFWRLWEQIDGRFTSFISSRMVSLANLPPLRPVLVSHIARFLQRRLNTRQVQRVALLVLDGLSLAQWMILKEELYAQEPDYCFNEDSCFSMIPSLTNVARQSIFSGELPVLFESSIDRTDMDGKRWKAFWDAGSDSKVSSKSLNIEGSEMDRSAVSEAVSTQHRALGITIRMADEILHGAKLGWRGVAQSLRLWANQGFLRHSINALLDAGYEVYLTSDHGNIEAQGAGSISQGVLADRSGQRVRIYRDQTIFQNTQKQLGPRGIDGCNKLLPSDYLPLLHAGRGAFVPHGQTIISHGGASLDEVTVPFIEISRLSKL